MIGKFMSEVFFPGIFDTTAQQAYMENTEAYEQLFLDAEKYRSLQRGSLYDGTAKKPDFKRFSGTEKGHRNSIKITVALWRRVRDLNPGDIIHALRDFESRLFDHLSNSPYHP